MNDPIKYMIAAGTIAAVSMGAGVFIGWELRTVKSEEFKVKSGAQVGSGQFTVKSAQRPVNFSPSVFPAGGTNTRFVVSRGANVFATGGKPGTGKGNVRLVTSSPTGSTSNPAYQKVQNGPEVVKAREELVAAQKRAADVMEKTMKETVGGISFDAFHKVRLLPVQDGLSLLIHNAFV